MIPRWLVLAILSVFGGGEGVVQLPDLHKVRVLKLTIRQYGDEKLKEFFFIVTFRYLYSGQMDYVLTSRIKCG